ncbi:facilitated trehalose transporter Tret1-like [Sitophilus oryzae]|uniref:Facilitated trehalose transporter Tret1-like n=1 Tax=Sitophilus oryzae TaxID=7048 RepID=A0A6J2YV13_SITOR|nr:facilitated trehalose transporter Tret1-like [Sitophilus oryzae]
MFIRFGSKDDPSNFRRYLPQLLAVLIKNFNLFIFGLAMAMPTILIPMLGGNDEDGDEVIILSDEAISWIASVNHLCVPIGCLLSGFVSSPMGRKRFLQINSLPFFGAFLLLYFATQPWQLFLALSVTGISGGLSESPALSYTTEITEPTLKRRILFTFILAAFNSWRTVALVNAIIPLVGVVFLALLPESPYWLLDKNRVDDAKRSLAWLRGWTTVHNIEKEFGEIQHNVEENRTTKKRKSLFNKATAKLYFKSNFIKPFLLVILTFILSHFNVTPYTTYAIKIFSLLRVPINSYYATIITGTCNMSGSLLCLMILSITGKRLLSFISLLGISICFLIVGIYTWSVGVQYFTDDTSLLDETTTWIPLVFLVLMGFFSYLLSFALPWVIMGEIYYHEVRDVATGVSAAVGYLIGFLANKTFLNMVSWITLGGVFWFYSAVTAVGIILLYFFLPETEGKSFGEIYDHYSGVKKLDNKVRRDRNH